MLENSPAKPGIRCTALVSYGTIALHKIALRRGPSQARENQGLLRLPLESLFKPPSPGVEMRTEKG